MHWGLHQSIASIFVMCVQERDIIFVLHPETGMVGEILYELPIQSLQVNVDPFKWMVLLSIACLMPTN